jgi:hypothetical protein
MPPIGGSGGRLSESAKGGGHDQDPAIEAWERSGDMPVPRQRHIINELHFWGFVINVEVLKSGRYFGR